MQRRSGQDADRARDRRRLLRRWCLSAILGYVALGAFFAAVLLTVSLFQSGPRAAYFRLLSVAPLLVGTAVGVLQAARILFLALTNRIYRPKDPLPPLAVPPRSSRIRHKGRERPWDV